MNLKPVSLVLAYRNFGIRTFYGEEGEGNATYEFSWQMFLPAGMSSKSVPNPESQGTVLFFMSMYHTDVKRMWLNDHSGRCGGSNGLKKA